MMGTRGYRGADECDAFSRRSRTLLNYKRGELRAIKRRFWKRARKFARIGSIFTPRDETAK